MIALHAVGEQHVGGDVRLRVAVVAETFLPNVNGVTNSVLRVVEHLCRHGHEVLVVAPGPGTDVHDGVPVRRVRSVSLPRYGDLRIGFGRSEVAAALREFRPDVVHAASPVLLGAQALAAARRLDVPAVAVFQTDVAGFAKRHHLGCAGDVIWSHLRRVHAQADRTLAPSTASVWALRARGVPRVERWARGVDLERFHPRHRSGALHRALAPHGEVVVGHVGRLAKEKQVERLAAVAARDDCRVVIVGDGPERARLMRKLPRAQFVGFRHGSELSQLFATFDVFVHTGIDETFCQSLQEAMSSGVAVVGPSVGGPLDLVRHGVTGFLWAPESPETLEGAVAELIADSQLRARFGAAARVEAERRPWATIMAELDGHYLDVLGRARHSVRSAA